MVRLILVLLTLALTTSITWANEVRHIVGKPSIMVQVDGDHSQVYTMEDPPKNLWVVISVQDGVYTWSSRENTPLYPPAESGMFSTFMAKNGSGYIRILNNFGMELKKSGQFKSHEGLGLPHAKYDYVEHLQLGLQSIIYYGVFVGQPWEYPWEILRK